MSQRFRFLLARAVFVSRASAVVVRNPRQALERALDVRDDRRERRRRPYSYRAVAEWHRVLHELFDLPWPCSPQAEFDELWSQLGEELSRRGITLGRESYGGWDDAGSALSLAAYCLARHLRPELALETGVGHGVTTRMILEALQRNGSGHLWSVDLPPLVATELHAELAAAVPEGLRSRWTLCLGSSRRRLPPLLADLGSIGLFVHDSLHTERNLRFELDNAWPHVDPGGALLLDDVDFNPGLRAFAAQMPEARPLVAEHADRRRLFSVIRKP